MQSASENTNGTQLLHNAILYCTPAVGNGNAQSLKLNTNNSDRHDRRKAGIFVT